MFLIAREHEDIKEVISKIPQTLMPVIDRIAVQLASVQGYKYDDNYNFLGSTNPRSIQMCRLALVAMEELQEFCMDEWGTTLEDLVDEDE